MIDRISGSVAAAGPNWVVVQTGGLGLKAWCTPATAARVRPGHECELFTTLVPREDSLTLYGFATDHERDAFELVQTAPGVGPKLALAIVSVLAPADLAAAIGSEDVRRLTSVPGVGAKGAQKIILELKDKVAVLAAAGGAGATASPQAQAEGWREQVSGGLQGLGWSARDAEAACDNVAPMVEQDANVPVAVLMRAALQSLAR
ncbi:Holliday junction branch migration protein RuvA [Propionibacteriaceae bacterium G1746]|uniref:Holliday junction branch migration protein RuvA n=1 Tax=Aestuariimicrobium sp. G57 TaxID=3418485 RepID=UPI003C220F7F